MGSYAYGEDDYYVPRPKRPQRGLDPSTPEPWNGRASYHYEQSQVSRSEAEFDPRSKFKAFSRDSGDYCDQEDWPYRRGARPRAVPEARRLDYDVYRQETQWKEGPIVAEPSDMLRRAMENCGVKCFHAILNESMRDRHAWLSTADFELFFAQLCPLGGTTSSDIINRKASSKVRPDDGTALESTVGPPSPTGRLVMRQWARTCFPQEEEDATFSGASAFDCFCVVSNSEDGSGTHWWGLFVDLVNARRREGPSISTYYFDSMFEERQARVGSTSAKVGQVLETLRLEMRREYPGARLKTVRVPRLRLQTKGDGYRCGRYLLWFFVVMLGADKLRRAEAWDHYLSRPLDERDDPDFGDFLTRQSDELTEQIFSIP